MLPLSPGGLRKNTRTEPDQDLPQRLLEARACGFCRCRHFVLAQWQYRPGASGGRDIDRPLHQHEAGNALPAKMRIGALNDNGSKMLHFERESGLDPDNEHGPIASASLFRAARAGRPLDFDGAGSGGESFARDTVPIEDERSLAKSALCQHGPHGRLKEVAQRPRPGNFCAALISHGISSPLLQPSLLKWAWTA